MKLLYDKTVVYATNQLEFSEAADLILVSYTKHLCVAVETFCTYLIELASYRFIYFLSGYERWRNSGVWKV